VRRSNVPLWGSEFDDMDILREIRLAFENGHVQWRRHALERMLERGISRREVTDVIANGRVIESYEEERVIPTYLVFGATRVGFLHVVVSYDESRKDAYVVTTYRPDAEHFEGDMITRKGS